MMGQMSEWKVFGSLAVHRLGMPQEFMPFYSDNKSYQLKADRVLAFILETGNFGHNRDHSRYAFEPAGSKIALNIPLYFQ
jgi:hypothetical protein